MFERIIKSQGLLRAVAHRATLRALQVREMYNQAEFAYCLGAALNIKTINISL
jgi:hypothetical protein